MNVEGVFELVDLGVSTFGFDTGFKVAMFKILNIL